MRENRRPADYQIEILYRCDNCRREISRISTEPPSRQCSCGGLFNESGMSYPGDSEEWDEERDSPYDDWRQRR